MSTFVSHLSHDLSLRVLAPSSVTTSPTPGPSSRLRPSSETVETLRNYFLQLEPPTTLSAARQCLATLQQLESEFHLATITQTGAADVGAEIGGDEEEATLRRAILGKVVVGLYVQGLNTFLDEASSADAELEWWGDLARSKWNVALYLLQTLPIRLLNVSRTILHAIRSQNIPFHPLVLSPSSLRRLFPTRNILRPNTLTVALFPYLRHQPYAITLSNPHFSTDKSLRVRSLQENAEALAGSVLTSFRDTLRILWDYTTLPFDLVRGECDYKRKELEKIRNERAEILGALSDTRQQLMRALEWPSNEEGITELAYFACQLQATVRGEGPSSELPTGHQGILGALYSFAYTTLPSHISSHSSHLSTHGLLRPSRLTLLWPRLVFLPPLALYLIRSAYVSRASLAQMAHETVETLRDFWEDWLLAPLKDVVKTVRAGSDDGVIITRESVKADLDSLERMTLALAQDRLGYGPDQMAALSKQIRLGDLTPVMQLYEGDIKNPLRSAVGGTLLRTLFVQVQKAKVDIDQALSGIDKLLKSQELTFAFVGVAPALAIVYAVGGALYRLWSGSTGRGRYGGKRRRVRVWLAMRRVERLLIAQPRSHRDGTGNATEPSIGSSRDVIPPLTSGLLLLSVTYLRRYGETRLPANSRLREGFLEDIADLESPVLGRAEKMRVVDRMWKSWGGILGWGGAAVQSGPL